VIAFNGFGGGAESPAEMKQTIKQMPKYIPFFKAVSSFYFFTGESKIADVINGSP